MRNVEIDSRHEIDVCLKSSADAVSQAEIDLLATILPELLRAIALEELNQISADSVITE